MAQNQENKVAPVFEDGGGKSMSFILSVAAAIIVAGLGVFFTFQKGALQTQQTQIDNEILAIQGEIRLLEEQKVEAAQQAQEWLAAIEQEEVRWSKVIQAMEDLIPTNLSTGQDSVRFLSYSGSEGGRLSMNGQTVPHEDEPFDFVAETIAVFNSNPFFMNAYVPSITRSETNDGSKFGTFVFSVEYQEEEFSGFDDEPAVAEDESVSDAGDSEETDTTSAGVAR